MLHRLESWKIVHGCNVDFQDDIHLDWQESILVTFAEHVWKRAAREAVWLPRQIIVPTLVFQTIYEFSDLSQDFQKANELERVAPLLAALRRKHLVSWNDLKERC